MKKNIQSIIIFTAFFAASAVSAGGFSWLQNQQLIRMGSRGDQVIQLQQCLAELGNNPDSNIDGIFGPITRAAVISFQTEHGLLIDGIIGNQTGPKYEEVCTAKLNKEELSENISVVEKNTDEEEKIEEDTKETSTIPTQDTTSVSTKSATIKVDGSLNDYADFEITFDLRAFGNTFYISEYANNSFYYSIIDANTGAVVYDSDGIQAGSSTASVSSSAEMDGNFYRIDEDEYEEFTLSVAYSPHGGTPAGTGSYRLRLDSVDYSSTAGGTTNNHITRPESKFRTKATQVID